MSLDVQAWALNPDLALPDLHDYTLTPIFSGVGAVSLDYPRDGRNFAALRRLVDEDRPIEIETRTDGTSATALRFLLFTAAGDDILPGAVWTFTGLDLGCLLGDWRLPYNTDPAQGGNDKGETGLSGTAGVILRTLLQRAQIAGYLLDVTFGTFSNTLDSAAAAWAKTTVVTLSPGTTILDVLDVLVKAGLCEWEVTNARALRCYNAGTRGVDRALPGPGQRTLEQGRDLADAPVRHDVTKAITNVIAAGKDGIYSAAVNATALARIGWRRALYSSFGNIADQGSLDAATTLTASISGNGVDEQTHALVLETGSVIVPGRDVALGDWILRGVGGTATRKRIVSYQLARKGPEISANLVLGNLIDSRAKRVQDQIDGLSGGSIVVGTSAPPPDVDDGKAPAAPAGLSASSSAYYDGGTPLAQVTAAWTAVTTNADGTAIGDLDHYEVQYRYGPGQSLPTSWQIAASPAATSATFSPIVAGKALDVQVYAIDKYGHRSAASPTVTITTGSDATPPPVLPAPTGSAYLGITKWDWNGKGAAGEVMPPDFLEAELHLSTTSNFTPNRPLLADGRTLDTAASTTYRDHLTGAGELPVDPGGAYGVTWFAKWVAVDKSRNASAASAQGSAVRVQAADGDLSGLSVGKLMTGIMSALLTISGIIRTATAGARVELDTTGLRCISSTGAILFEFNIPSNLLTMTGKLVSGMGIGIGPTIVVDPGAGNPIVRMYTDATQRRVEQSAYTSNRPGGGTGPTYNLASLNPSGVQDGPALQMWTNGVWFYMSDTAGHTRGGRLVLGRPGGVIANNDPSEIARLSYQDSNDAINYVQAAADSCRLEVANGAHVVVTSVGDLFLTGATGRTVFVDNNDLNVTGGTRVNARRFANDGNGANIEARSGADVFFYWAGAQLNIGQGASFVKTFVIDHPTDPDRWLVHGCVEGPEAAVEYRGVAELVDGAAVVQLPAYFEAVTRAEGRTVHVTMLLPDEPLTTHSAPADPVPVIPYAPVDVPDPVTPPEWALIHPVAASIPRDGRFRIASPAPDGTRISWLVKAVRADVPVLDVEPLRSTVQVGGDGPYRYIREAA